MELMYDWLYAPVEEPGSMPVVYVTRAEGHDWASLGVPNSALIAKPFAPAQVLTAVSQLLNVGNTPGA